LKEFDLEVLQLLASHHSGIEIFPLLKQTKEGNPLTPLSIKNIPEGRNTQGIIPEGIIPKGYVFVAGDNLNSFDSRYEEFGLVPVEKIWGKAVLWW
jgi:type IV secretory pathway protease TraF